MTLLYGIPNCDQVKAARAWLSQRGIDHDFIDLRSAPVSAEQIRHWLSQIPAASLINTRSTTWRQLSDAERSAAQGEGVINLLQSHPTLIKRPLVQTDSQLFCGFSAEIFQQHFASR